MRRKREEYSENIQRICKNMLFFSIDMKMTIMLPSNHKWLTNNG